MSTDLASLFNNAKKVKLVTAPDKKPSEEPIEQSSTVESELDEENDKITAEREDPAIANASTVFVGNVPVNCSSKKLKKLFSQFGTVQSVRLRNLVPLHTKRGKRLAFIKKELHPLQKTVTAFVCFSDPMEAQSATSLNGCIYKEHHLRVDMAHDQNDEVKHDTKRSIFIGNLPFDANDDDVWKAFEECGEIESVRLVRDRDTSVGKGFGYVLFKDEASVALALRLNGNCQIGNRQVRIKTAVKKPKVGQGRPFVTTQMLDSNRRSRGQRQGSKNEKKPVQEGRVGKRPSVQRKKELQKKKKAIKTTNARKDVIQLKRKS